MGNRYLQAMQKAGTLAGTFHKYPDLVFLLEV
jgi:hypothetical protein